MIKEDPRLTKARVSLKNMMKLWDDFDQGFLVECRALEGGISSAEESEIEVLTVEESVSIVLKKFEDFFMWLETLPLRRDIEHHIHIKKGTNPMNV